jgi:RimJ/RimL family protein N-acetyltransferase
MSARSENDAIEIRRLGPDDLDAWHDMRIEMLLLVPTAFGDSHEEALARGKESFLDHLTKPDVAIFGAFSKGALVGSACFAQRSEAKERHKGLMWGVYARPTMRGAGVGEAVVGAVIEHAKGQVEILQAMVGARNEPARALYRRMGFVTYGLERRAIRVNGVYIDEELIALDFSAPPSLP